MLQVPLKRLLLNIIVSIILIAFSSYLKPLRVRFLTSPGHYGVVLFDENQDNNINISVHLNSAMQKIYLESVPVWLKEYAEWHADQRKNHIADPATKFLILACERYSFCGGVADRLKNIPFYLLFAHKSGRVLLIKWEKGNDLEDFLVPPIGGINWTLPSNMTISDGYHMGNWENIMPWLQEPIQETSVKRYRKLVIGGSAGTGGSMDFYRIEQQYKPNNAPAWFSTKRRPNGIMKETWEILFEPTPSVQNEITKTMSELGLSPRKYVVVHFRAEDIYFKKEDLKSSNDSTLILLNEDDYTTDEERISEIHNAIDCAFQLSQKHKDTYNKVYFTSSDNKDVKYVLRKSPYKDKVIGKDDVIRFHSDEPYQGWKDELHPNPEHLYQTYVDLYIMKNSYCVAYGSLGFGLLGARIAGEKCMLNYEDRKSVV